MCARTFLLLLSLHALMPGSLLPFAAHFGVGATSNSHLFIYYSQALNFVAVRDRGTKRKKIQFIYPAGYCCFAPKIFLIVKHVTHAINIATHISK